MEVCLKKVFVIILLASSLISYAELGFALTGKFNTLKIEKLTGLKGQLNETEGVFKVIFMHSSGMGDEEKLAAAVGKVYAKIKETLGAKENFPTTKIDPAKSSFDSNKIETVLGQKGDFKNGVLKITVGRKTKMSGLEVGNA